MKRAGLFVIAVVVVATPQLGEARVTRLTVEQTRPLANGRAFGSAGPYVRLDGTAWFEVDPKDPAERAHRQPRQGAAQRQGPGRVQDPRSSSSSPSTCRRGNQKILYGINNRGNHIELRFHSVPAARHGCAGGGRRPHLSSRLHVSSTPGGPATSTSTENRLGAELPGGGRGRTAVQSSRRFACEYDEASFTGHTLPLKGNTRFRSYETADTDTARSTLTVRDAIGGEKQADRVRPVGVRPLPERTGVARAPPRRICACSTDSRRVASTSSIYPAKNPWVMGLGYAVTRDIASFLRYAAARRRRQCQSAGAATRRLSASAAHMPPERRPPACTCATSCISGSTRTRAHRQGVRRRSHHDPGHASAVRERGVRRSRTCIRARMSIPISCRIRIRR